MSERICPLCRNLTQLNENFCRDCQEIAQKSTLSEIVEDENQTAKVDTLVCHELEKNKVINEKDALSSSSSKETTMETERSDENSTPDKPKQAKGSSKKLLIFYAVGLIVFTLVGLVSTYQIVQDRQSKETEAAYWQQCVDENTQFGYSKYLFRYPDGQFIDEAQEKLANLREKERVDWERVQKSTDLNDYFAFLADYKDTPYAQQIRMRMDSISWQSTTDLNTADAYLAYLDNVKLGHFEGIFQLQAQEKYIYLSQLKPIEGESLIGVQKQLRDVFKFLQNKQYKQLEPLMATEITKYYDRENMSKEVAIQYMQKNLKENKIRAYSYTFSNDSLVVVQDNEGVYFITLPVQKEVVYDDKKKKKELQRTVVSVELNDKKQLQALYEQPK